jgi:hypothetical protein
VTTIWFWNRSALVTDRFWRKVPILGWTSHVRWTDQKAYFAEPRAQGKMSLGTVTGD